MAPAEILQYTYWSVLVTLLKRGLPFEVIAELTEKELTIILALEQVLAEREADEHNRAMRF